MFIYVVYTMVLVVFYVLIMLATHKFCSVQTAVRPSTPAAGKYMCTNVSNIFRHWLRTCFVRRAGEGWGGEIHHAFVVLLMPGSVSKYSLAPTAQTTCGLARTHAARVRV